MSGRAGVGAGVWIGVFAVVTTSLPGCGPAWEWADLDEGVPKKLEMDEGTTYGDAIQGWAGDWWQWFARIPGGDDHPVRGGDCTQEQDEDSDVWYLAGNYFGDPETRQCTIPKGKYIYFPVYNTVSFCFWQECALWSDCEGSSCEELEASGAQDDWPEVEYPMTLTLERVDKELSAPLTEVEIMAYRAQSGCLELIPPEGARSEIYDSDSDCDFIQPWSEGNPCEDGDDAVPGTPKVGVAAGYYPLAMPPKRGEYVLHFTADNPDGGLLDITYELTIE